MKESYKIIKNDDRLFFSDGEKYVLFDSGFVNGSVSVNGKIGPFNAQTVAEKFMDSFINLKMPDGKNVTAVFNPMDGYNCLLQGDTIIITDEEMVLDNCKYFFPFIDKHLPLIEGSINGQNCRFFFDSGARMTMFGEKAHAVEKIKTYTEWLAMKHSFADLDVFKLNLTFPNGFEYQGEGALVTDRAYLMAAQMMNIKAMLGIDIFRHYDMAVFSKGKRGIGLLEKITR